MLHLRRHRLRISGIIWTFEHVRLVKERWPDGKSYGDREATDIACKTMLPSALSDTRSPRRSMHASSASSASSVVCFTRDDDNASWCKITTPTCWSVSRSCSISAKPFGFFSFRWRALRCSASRTILLQSASLVGLCVVAQGPQQVACLAEVYVGVGPPAQMSLPTRANDDIRECWNGSLRIVTPCPFRPSSGGFHFSIT